MANVFVVETVKDLFK